VSGSFRYPWIIDVAHVCIDCSAEKVIGTGGFFLLTAADECWPPGTANFEGSSRADCFEAELSKRLRRVEAAQCGSMQQLNAGCATVRGTMH
jgi:hypothetical protein